MRMEDARERAMQHLDDSMAVKQRVTETCIPSILAAAELLVQCFRAGGKLLLCGNGGSAADCQHTSAEFVGRLTGAFGRPGLPAMALTTDTSFLTAQANDMGFESIFARQVEALGRPGDVLLAISTSGNSANVLRAVSAAQRCRLATIALAGSNGALNDLADVAIAVPSTDTAHIQEAHLAIEHILCDLVEQALFEPAGDRAHDE